ncbi:DUF1453 family protein [Schauerella aestuarii]|uniref:DUF1453 family protein n=1 Tax=Schauerella aestuarii TaxID=2511204 RepID=UPI00136F9DD6|nr:DUF1453 family protein [Achromobacter aestuarii]MYZ42345.1 DUF1453 family protein [Achromobacter aestuarii]
MGNSQIAIIVALCVYALYRQTVRHTIDGHNRYKIAIIYAIVGLVIGGFHAPPTALAWAFLAGGLGLSAIVGYARGRLTRVWQQDGQIYAQGTALTITLFVLLIALKFALGTAEYFIGIRMHGSFGEILILIAVMVAFQSHIVWLRAQALQAQHPRASGPSLARPAGNGPLARIDTIEGN